MNVLRITGCGRASVISCVVCTTPLLGLLSACLLLSGCSKDRTETLGDQQYEITAQASIGEGPGLEVSSKAAVDQYYPLTFSFVRCDANNAGNYGNYGEVFTGDRPQGTGTQALSFTPKQYYSASGQKTKIIGWYPDATSYANNQVTWLLDGTKDVLIARAAEGSKTSAMPAFSFSHALTGLQVWCHAETGAAAKWGKITAIELQGVQNVCTYDLTTGKVTFSGDGSNISVDKLTAAAPPEGNANAAKIFGYPIVVPPLSKNQPLSLLFHTELRGDVSVVVPAQAYAAGQVTKFTVCFSYDGTLTVNPTIIIEDWIYSGSLKPTYPYVRNGNAIVCQDYFGSADNAEYPIHKPWISTPAHEEYSFNSNETGYNGVTAKFEVAAADIKIDYINDANSACNSYHQSTDDAMTWRVPTIRELKLIFDLKDQLTAIGTFDYNLIYISSTGNVSDSYFTVQYNEIQYSYYDGDLSLRCVRDLNLMNDVLPKVTDGSIIVTRSSWGDIDIDAYPQHDPWETTPNHSESTWTANTSGFNTVASMFEVASKNVRGVSNGNSDCPSYSQYADDLGSWRVPTIREMKLIYDMRDELTAVEPLDKVYITATTNTAGDIWRVNFNDGSVYTWPEAENKDLRCVRDALSRSAEYPIVNGNTITFKGTWGMADPVLYPIHSPWTTTPSHSEENLGDNLSGYNTVAASFEVATADASTSATWSEALTLCPSGWRLPTARELSAIYKLNNQLDAPLLNGTSYWSATACSMGAWGLSYLWGTPSDVEYWPSTDSYHVRCIRDRQ